MKFYIIIFAKIIFGSNYNFLTQESVSYDYNDSFCKGSYCDIKTSNNQNTLISLQNDNIDFNYEEQSNGNMELINFLDSIEFSEPSKEELDKCSPVSLDFNSLHEILNNKQDCYLSKENHNLTRYLKNNQSLHLEFNLKENFTTCSSKMNTRSKKVITSTIIENYYLNSSSFFVDTLNRPLTNFCLSSQDLFNEYVKRYRAYILHFISENISNSFIGIHITRICQISEAFEEFNAFNLDHKTCFSILEPSQENLLVYKLRYFFSIFDKKSEFNKKTCLEFIILFENNLYCEIYFSRLSNRSTSLSDCQRKFIFYSEFFKLFKYVADIPEILTLGRLYEKKTSFYLSFIMHSIDLFGKYIGNMKDNRVFIMCIIFKAFEVFYGTKYDFFLIPSFEFICMKNKHDLYYFCYEFNKTKRSNMKRTIYPNLYFNSKDFLYFKSVLLTYLYQHLLFIKHFNVSIENKKLFADFIDKVSKLNECIGCLLNEYLIIVQEINKEVF